MIFFSSCACGCHLWAKNQVRQCSTAFSDSGDDGKREPKNTYAKKRKVEKKEVKENEKEKKR